MEEHGDVVKTKKANPYPFCISKVINKILDILTNDLPTILPPNKDVDHKIEVHPRSTPPTKTPYRLNHKELEKLKRQINDLMERGYIHPNKLPYVALMLFVGKKDKKLKIFIDYQALNKITIKNNYLLLKIDNRFDSWMGPNTSVESTWNCGNTKFT